MVMRMLARAACIALACLFFPMQNAAAQQPANTNTGCSSEPTGSAQTLHCAKGITIVAEDGARFTLTDSDGDGRIDSAELSSKALLLEVPKKPGGNRFKVVAPQAIAAVRGTKWAVDAADNKTSVLVINGRVSVARPAGGAMVVLGPGEGVDVEATGELTVKRWAPARVSALLARLGQ